jgi:hypothetical protein
VVTAFTISSLVAATLCGLLMPAPIRVGDFDVETLADQTNPASVIIPMLAVILATLLVASWVAIAITEHRRPWPLAPMWPGPRARNWEILPAIIVAQAVLLFGPGRWEGTSLYVFDESQTFLWFAVPAAFAATFVTWFAAFGMTYAVAHLVRGTFESRGHRTIDGALAAPDAPALPRVESADSR